MKSDDITVIPQTYPVKSVEATLIEASPNPFNTTISTILPTLSLTNTTVGVSDTAVIVSNTTTTMMNTSLPLLNDLLPNPSRHPIRHPNSTFHSTTSNWYYGPSRFLEYMNTNFSRIQRSSNLHKKAIVYEKKGTTGMAGQMTGVCDTLLLAILHDRPFQSLAVQYG